RALVYHLEHIVATQQGSRHLHAAGTPAIRQGHLASAERHLITRYGHGFQQPAAQAAFGLFIEVSIVVALLYPTLLGVHGHARFSSCSASSCTGPRRSRRIK